MDATLITVFLRLKEPQVNAACELKEMVLVLKSAIYVDFFVWLFFFLLKADPLVSMLQTILIS